MDKSQIKKEKGRTVKRLCEMCNRNKRGVKRHRLFSELDDACSGENGYYMNICEKCEREKVDLP